MTAARISSVLAAGDALHLGPYLGKDCEGSKFHSPRPLLVRTFSWNSLLDQARGGSPAPVPDGYLDLCSVCQDNLVVYLSVLLAHDGETPQSVRRDFGNMIRDLGDEIWKHCRSV